MARHQLDAGGADAVVDAVHPERGQHLPQERLPSHPVGGGRVCREGYRRPQAAGGAAAGAGSGPRRDAPAEAQPEGVRREHRLLAGGVSAGPDPFRGQAAGDAHGARRVHPHAGGARGGPPAHDGGGGLLARERVGQPRHGAGAGAGAGAGEGGQVAPRPAGRGGEVCRARVQVSASPSRSDSATPRRLLSRGFVFPFALANLPLSGPGCAAGTRSGRGRGP